MPFQMIEPTNVQQPKVAREAITVSTRKAPLGGRIIVTFAIGVGVVEQAMWKPQQPLCLLWGSGPDAGMVKIMPHEAKLARMAFWHLRPNKAGTVFKVTTTALPSHDVGVYRGQKSAHRVEEDAVIVTLPRGFFGSADVPTQRAA